MTLEMFIETTYTSTYDDVLCVANTASEEENDFESQLK